MEISLKEKLTELTPEKRVRLDEVILNVRLGSQYWEEKSIHTGLEEVASGHIAEQSHVRDAHSCFGCIFVRVANVSTCS